MWALRYFRTSTGSSYFLEDGGQAQTFFCLFGEGTVQAREVEQFGEYRFLARIDYEIALTAKKDLRATAGVRDVFDSYVEPGGDSTNDLKMYVGLKYEF